MPVVRFILGGEEGEISQERVAKGHYEVGDGWLRRAGFLYNLQELGLKEYAEMPCVVKQLTDQQMADLVMEANTVRKDLNPIELAGFYKRYLEDFKIPQVELARRHNCSQGEIANTIRLLKLPEEIQEEIISQKISPTMGLTLLPVLDLPEKKQKRIFKEAQGERVTVRDIEQSVKRVWWDTTLCLDPNYKTWDGSETPAFDIAGCAKCEYRKVLTHPWRDGEKQPRCSNRKCWHDKQREAKAEERKGIIAKLEKMGIAKLYNPGELQWDQFERSPGNKDMLDKPGDCKDCEHRAGMIDQYNENRVQIVCTNPTCWRGKRNKKSHDKNLAEAEAKQKRSAKLEKDFQSIDIGDHHVLLTTIECLLRATYGATDIMAEVFHIVEKDGDKPIRIDQVRKALAGKPYKELLALLPRLSFEILKGRYAWDDKLHKHMLDQFLATPDRKKPESQAIDKDQVAEFYKAKNPVAAFQNANCPGCFFAIPERIGTGEPCCIADKVVEIKGGRCMTRQGPGNQEPLLK